MSRFYPTDREKEGCEAYEHRHSRFASYYDGDYEYQEGWDLQERREELRRQHEMEEEEYYRRQQEEQPQHEVPEEETQP